MYSSRGHNFEDEKSALPPHFTIAEIQIVYMYVYYIFFNIYQSWNVQFQRPQSWECRYPLYGAVPLNGVDHCA